MNHLFWNLLFAHCFVKSLPLRLKKEYFAAEYIGNFRLPSFLSITLSFFLSPSLLFFLFYDV